MHSKITGRHLPAVSVPTPRSAHTPTHLTPTDLTPTDHTPTDVSDGLLQLVVDAGVYREVLRGKPQLSLVTGLLAQDLVNHCGVSNEKLPTVVLDVLSMFFGEVDEVVLSELLYASNTYSTVQIISTAQN